MLRTLCKSCRKRNLHLQIWFLDHLPHLEGEQLVRQVYMVNWHFQTAFQCLFSNAFRLNEIVLFLPLTNEFLGFFHSYFYMIYLKIAFFAIFFCLTTAGTVFWAPLEFIVSQLSYSRFKIEDKYINCILVIILSYLSS